MGNIWVELGLAAGAAITLSIVLRIYIVRRKNVRSASAATGANSYSVSQSNITTAGGDNAGRDINKNTHG